MVRCVINGNNPSLICQTILQSWIYLLHVVVGAVSTFCRSFRCLGSRLKAKAEMYGSHWSSNSCCRTLSTDAGRVGCSSANNSVPMVSFVQECHESSYEHVDSDHRQWEAGCWRNLGQVEALVSSGAVIPKLDSRTGRSMISVMGSFTFTVVY